MGLLSKVDDIAGLMSIGGDALIEVLAGIVDAVGHGTEFSGEQLDRMGELFQTGADRIRELRSGTPEGSETA